MRTGTQRGCLWNREALTSVLRELPAVDLVLHHVGPVEGVLGEVEVQGDGVPEARHQHAELSLVQVDAADLVAVREDDEGFERICEAENTHTHARTHTHTHTHTHKTHKHTHTHTHKSESVLIIKYNKQPCSLDPNWVKKLLFPVNRFNSFSI